MIIRGSNATAKRGTRKRDAVRTREDSGKGGREATGERLPLPKVSAYRIERWKATGGPLGGVWKELETHKPTRFQAAWRRMQQLAEQEHGTAPVYCLMEIFDDGRQVMIDCAPGSPSDAQTKAHT